MATESVKLEANGFQFRAKDANITSVFESDDRSNRDFAQVSSRESTVINRGPKFDLTTDAVYTSTDLEQRIPSIQCFWGRAPDRVGFLEV